MKYIMNFKKVISLITMVCLLISFVVGPTAASTMTNEEATKKYKQIFTDFMLPYNYGQIVASHYAGTDRVIVNIQDLHCHPQVQKNISNIIETFDKSYGVKKVYLEGAYGQVSTGWITKRIDNNIFNEVIEKMLQTGRLTGAEYYSVISGKTEIISGLEKKEPYLENLKRFGEIVSNQKKINLILKAVEESTEKIKKQYYTQRQFKLEELSKQYKEGTITPQKYYALLNKHADRLGIDLSKYENTFTYMMLLELQKHLDYSKITSDLQNLVLMLKENLNYNAYQMLVDNTDNFSKLDKLYGYIIRISRELNLDLEVNFAELDKYFRYIELSQKINPLELISEEERLTEEVNTRFSETKAQREVVFLTSFERYLKDYVSSKITSDDYEYYKANIEIYKKLWNKYVDNKVLSLLDEYITEADKFYKINTDRNIYFTDNMFKDSDVLNKIETKVEAKEEINKIIENMKQVKEVDIVITGGFHSQTVTEILKNHGVSYIVITPNVVEGTKLAEETYYKIAQEQSKISFQALATLPIAAYPENLRVNAVVVAFGKEVAKAIFGEEKVNLAIANKEKVIEENSEEKVEEIAKELKTKRDTILAKLLESDDVKSITEIVNKYLPQDNQITEDDLVKIKEEKLPELLENKKLLEKVINIIRGSTLEQSTKLAISTIETPIAKVSELFEEKTENLVKDEENTKMRESLIKDAKGFPKLENLSQDFRKILKQNQPKRYTSIIEKLEEIEKQNIEELDIDTLKEYTDLQKQLWNITKGEMLLEEMAKLRKIVEENTDAVFATVGNSDAPKGYDKTSTSIVSSLVNKAIDIFGKNRVCLITSPTADGGSIDATTTILSQAYDTLIVYVTALDYIKYVNPQNFTQEEELTNLHEYVAGFENKEEFIKEVNIEKFMDAMKFVANDGDLYSELVSLFKNITVVTGGRNVASYKDVVNAIKHNNVVLLTRSSKLVKITQEDKSKKGMNERIVNSPATYKNGLIIVDNTPEYIYLMNELVKKGAITEEGNLIQSNFENLTIEEKNLFLILKEKRVREDINKLIGALQETKNLDKKTKIKLIDSLYDFLLDKNILDEKLDINIDLADVLFEFDNIIISNSQIKELAEKCQVTNSKLNEDDKLLLDSILSLPKDNIINLAKYDKKTIDKNKSIIVFCDIKDDFDSKISKTIDNFSKKVFSFLDNIKYFKPILEYSDFKVNKSGYSAEVKSSPIERKVIPFDFAIHNKCDENGIHHDDESLNIVSYVIEEKDEKTGKIYYRLNPLFDKNNNYPNRMIASDISNLDIVDSDVICNPVLVWYQNGSIGLMQEESFVVNYGEESSGQIKTEKTPFKVMKKGGISVSAFIVPVGTRIRTPEGVVTVHTNEVVIKNSNNEDIYVSTIDSFLKNYSEEDNPEDKIKDFYENLKYRNQSVYTIMQDKEKTDSLFNIIETVRNAKEEGGQIDVEGEKLKKVESYKDFIDSLFPKETEMSKRIQDFIECLSKQERKIFEEKYLEFLKSNDPQISFCLALCKLFHNKGYYEPLMASIKSEESPIIDVRLFDKNYKVVEGETKEEVEERAEKLLKFLKEDAQNKVKNFANKLDADKSYKITLDDFVNTDISNIQKFFKIANKNITKEQIEKLLQSKKPIANTLQVPWEYLEENIQNYKDKETRKKFLIGKQIDGAVVIMIVLSHMLQLSKQEQNEIHIQDVLSYIHAAWSLNNEWDGLSKLKYQSLDKALREGDKDGYLSLHEMEKDFYVLKTITQIFHLTGNPFIERILKEEIKIEKVQKSLDKKIIKEFIENNYTLSNSETNKVLKTENIHDIYLSIINKDFEQADNLIMKNLDKSNVLMSEDSIIVKTQDGNYYTYSFSEGNLIVDRFNGRFVNLDEITNVSKTLGTLFDIQEKQGKEWVSIDCSNISYYSTDKKEIRILPKNGVEITKVVKNINEDYVSNIAQSDKDIPGAFYLEDMRNLSDDEIRNILKDLIVKNKKIVFYVSRKDIDTEIPINNLIGKYNMLEQDLSRFSSILSELVVEEKYLDIDSKGALNGSPSDFVKNLFVMEILKNALVHGNKMNTTSPIYINIQQKKIEISNEISKDDISNKVSTASEKLHGFGLGLKNIEKSNVGVNYFAEEKNGLYIVSLSNQQKEFKLLNIKNILINPMDKVLSVISKILESQMTGKNIIADFDVSEQIKEQAKEKGINIVRLKVIEEESDMRGGQLIDEQNKIRMKYNKSTNELIVYSKQGINVDVNKIKNLISTAYNEGRRNLSFSSDDIISFAESTDTKIEDIENRLKNTYTDSIVNPISLKYDFRQDTSVISEKICKGIKSKTGLSTFIISKEQAEKYAKDIESLNEKYKFIVVETDVDTFEQKIVNSEESEFMFDISSKEIDVTKILEKIKQAKLSVKKGVDISVSVKMNSKVVKELSENLAKEGKTIYGEYGIIPIVSATDVSSVAGKKEIDNIDELSKNQLDTLKGNEIVGFVVNEKAVLSLHKDVLDNIKTVLENLVTINESTPERKYKKALNASMSTKFDYSVSNVKSLINIITTDITSQDIEKVVKGIDLSSLSNDAKSYVEYQIVKGNYIEVLGFVRGCTMNTLSKDISNIINIDSEKLQKEIKTNEVQAVLIMTIQAMMQGKELEELYKTGVGSDTMSAEEYIQSIRSKVNGKLEEVLKQNEYKVVKPVALVDFDGIPELLMEDFRKEIEVAQEVKISALAVKSILVSA